MRIVVDRIEEKTAVCQLPDRSMLQIPAALFGENLKEGDIFQIEKITDTEAEEKRRQNLQDRFKKLSKH